MAFLIVQCCDDADPVRSLGESNFEMPRVQAAEVELIASVVPILPPYPPQYHTLGMGLISQPTLSSKVYQCTYQDISIPPCEALVAWAVTLSKSGAKIVARL